MISLFSTMCYAAPLEITASSCNLVGTLSINIDADFTQIKGYAEKLLPEMPEIPELPKVPEKPSDNSEKTSNDKIDNTTCD